MPPSGDALVKGFEGHISADFLHDILDVSGNSHLHPSRTASGSGSSASAAAVTDTEPIRAQVTLGEWKAVLPLDPFICVCDIPGRFLETSRVQEDSPENIMVWIAERGIDARYRQFPNAARVGEVAMALGTSNWSIELKRRSNSQEVSPLGGRGKRARLQAGAINSLLSIPVPAWGIHFHSSHTDPVGSDLAGPGSSPGCPRPRELGRGGSY